MAASTSDRRFLAGSRQPTELSISCDLPPVTQWAIAQLTASGFRTSPGAPITLVLDAPRGHALDVLEASGMPGSRLVVATWNYTPEYLEDLWDARPDALLGGRHVDRDLGAAVAEAIERSAGGEPYRDTPYSRLRLKPAERAVLRYVVLGWDHRRSVAGST